MAVPLILLAAAATGVTDTPCPPAIPIPPAIGAWRQKTYAPDNAKMVPPPLAEAGPYFKAYQEARKTDWADLCRYRDDNAKLIALPQSARDVVFMGDSITEGWNYGDKGFFTGGWIDRGISGQTTPQMLLRFPGDVIALHPRVVHIMAGTNDIAGNTGPTSMDTIVGNIAAMVTLAKAAGIRVVLAATPPADKFGWRSDLRPAPQIAALNARLRELAEREKVTFVDYGSVLATPDGAMKDALTLDGVHPNAEGYAAMGPLAKKAVAAALAARR
ncbi:GDSL-type esterase/lipase family protein [Sphingomonas sp.]|uniref:GDSL-type esterase/lipase family protein n=1 Tax=Sphingomonas sp. TaxID=28214 RepID=UPI0025E838B2|nr:GDSL-type esterase/lipase family protein [Sphingomonas sp.]